MSISLPNLDDRRWLDLVDQGTSLIPFYAPRWTDYNLSDPGITLIELLAWMTERDVYQFNRIPASHALKFLKLVGGSPASTQPARVIIAAVPTPGVNSITIPASAEFTATLSQGKTLTYRTRDDVTVVAAGLSRVCVDDGAKLLDVYPSLTKQSAVSIFGSNPAPGAAIYFGFDRSLPPHCQLSIHMAIAGDHANPSERMRIIADATLHAQRCQRFKSNPCCMDVNLVSPPTDNTVLVHPSVTTMWEYFDGTYWTALVNTQVVDQTRSFTLTGTVTLTLPTASQPCSIAFNIPPGHFLRCRFVGGSYDAAPLLESVSFNALEAIQLSSGTVHFQIAPRSTITGALPLPGTIIHPLFQLGADGAISTLDCAVSGPAFRLLSYAPPNPAAPGSITLEATLLGRSTGLPGQTFSLPDALSMQSPLNVLTWEAGIWRAWQVTADLDSAGPSDAFATTDSNATTISFGDGLRAFVPPANAMVFVTASFTAGNDGNIAASAINALADSPHNHSFPNYQAISTGLAFPQTSNPSLACSGADAETVGDAEETAMLTRTATGRAVTLADYETLALKTPGFQLARIFVLPGVDPRLPCGIATGVVTLVVIPFLPLDKPNPDRALLTAVSNHLASYRIAGTAIRVVGPRYVNIRVEAVVVAAKGSAVIDVQKTAAAAVLAFLHPLTGGDDAKGWPLGRSVHSAELLQVIAAAPGVGHVVSIELIDEHGKARPHVICIGTFGLVAACPPQIQVRRS